MPTRQERQPQANRLALEQVVTSAKETTLMLGRHLPTIAVEGSQQSAITTLEVLAETHTGRLEQMRETGWYIGSMGVVGILEQVFFVSEAQFNNHPNEIKDDLSPAETTECLVVSAYHIDTGRIDIQASEMVRDAGGLLTEFKDYSLPSDMKMMVIEPLLGAFLEGYIVGLMEPLED